MRNFILKSGLALLVIVFGCGGPGRFQGPRVISKSDLDYPLSAQLNRIEGDVVVGVFVNPLGRADEVRLLESSGHEELDGAALEFSKNVNFEPAYLDGKALGTWTKLVLRYKLTEVLFEKDRWLYDVKTLQKQAAAERDAIEQNKQVRRLLTHCVGLSNYVERINDVRINDTIRNVLLSHIEKRWNPFWDVMPAPFAVFDDLIERFPNSEYVERAKEELIRQLIDAEYKIRIQSLKSGRVARKSLVLIDLIKVRLDELQPSIQK